MGTFFRTVTSQVAVRPPSADVTVITAVPGEIAVRKPSWSTTTTLSSLLSNETAVFVALAGVRVTVKEALNPTVSSIEALFRLIPVTALFLDSFLQEPTVSNAIPSIATNPMSDSFLYIIFITLMQLIFSVAPKL